MSDVIINGMEPETNERQKTLHAIVEMIHSAGRVIETAEITEDPEVLRSTQSAAKALIDAAMAKMDESIGATIADDTDEDE